MPWLRLIRLPNLIIILLTQYILEYLFLYPIFQKYAVSGQLNLLAFFLLAMVTVITAGAGYVINDIEDALIDQWNKPDRVVIGRFIATANAKRAYWLLVVSGFAFAVACQWFLPEVPMITIYLTATFLLHIYAKKLKRMALWGNLMVAVLCVYVVAIIAFAEGQAINALWQKNAAAGEFVAIVFATYIGFVYCINMKREIVKDIEDIRGDVRYGCRTLPIVLGVKWTKVIAGVFATLLTVLIGFFSYYLWNLEEYYIFAYVLLFVLIPTIGGIVLLEKAKTIGHYRRLSKYLKWIMLAGMLLIVFMGRII